MYYDKPRQRFEANKKISKVNKQYVEDFFKSYNCAESTAARVYSYLPYFLEQTKDAKKAIKSHETMATIFDNIHKKLSPAAYQIAKDTTKAFVKRLNENAVPDTWQSIKKLTKNEKKRLKRISRDDYKMMSWEDGLKMCRLTTSQQMKALVQVELEGGFRPGELEGLNYGDCTKDKKFIVIHVKPGKTGEARDVLLYRAAPSLNRWLDMHPTKKKTDPLWLIENPEMSSLSRNNKGQTRYNYYAIKQILRRLGKKAGLGNVSMYRMRHSSIMLSKEEGMNPDLGAERYGHDIVYYVSTYGKLTPKQKIARAKAHYGEAEPEKKQKPQSKVCHICDTINEPGREFCEKCNSPLSLKKALEVETRKDSEIQELKKQVEAIARMIADRSTKDQVKLNIKRRQGK